MLLLMMGLKNMCQSVRVLNNLRGQFLLAGYELHVSTEQLVPAGIITSTVIAEADRFDLISRKHSQLKLTRQIGLYGNATVLF